MTNRLCDMLGIEIPSLEKVKDHPEASSYSLMIVAILEHGGPMTLADVARRFEEAGIKPAHEALRALSRSRPGHPPLYRDGDIYGLDVHDEMLDRLLFRLGLRPSHVPHPESVRAEPAPLPGPDTAVSPAEVEEAFREGWLSSWSTQRLAIVLLDAYGDRMQSARLLEIINELTTHHSFRINAARVWRMGAVTAEEGGWWRLDRAHEAVGSARIALREAVMVRRRRQALQPDPAQIAANEERWERRRAANALKMARLRRVILRAFVDDNVPVAVCSVDVATRGITTLTGDELDNLSAHLAQYDFIAAEGVQPLLRRLGIDPGERRLAELGPPRKTVRLNRRGRTLTLTTELLVRGSCGISRPFGDPAKLRRYLETGQTGRFRRRLEADLKSLFALYSYGRLHGAYRLRWGFLDQMLWLRWVHRDEPMLYDMVRRASHENLLLEVVFGWAPGWEDPWARALPCRVVPGGGWGGGYLVDPYRRIVHPEDVQLARLVMPGEGRED